MKPILSTVVSLVSILLVTMPVAARSPEYASDWNAPAIAWRDIASGIKQATREQKPVVMVFHAPWCTSCKQYREVFRDPGVIQASKSFVMILINADADKVANGAFAPDGTYVPRTIFLDWEGNIRSEIRGTTDPEHPHTIDIKDPEELRALMLKAAPSQKPDPQKEARQ